MSFDSLGLSSDLLTTIADQGYTTPTPIQERAIPAILDNKDLLGAAQTGTGKTAAFVLPILERLGNDHKKKPRVLILAPTRELAAQISEDVATYSAKKQLKHTVVFGGVGYNPQINAFKKGVDIVIATPGRLLDHLSNGALDLKHLNTVVLDEADRMLDMGFIHDIKRILEYVPSKRQSLLFSATFSKDIRKLASQLLNEPEEIDVAPRNSTASQVSQRVIMVDKTQKRAVLSHMIRSQNWYQVLVFTRTKHGANRLVKQLEADGINSAALHGNKSQNARTQALSGFKKGDTQVLVATDIAARGIDIDTLPYVVNYELPSVAEDYVHRIGRTGRAGSTGEALSLVGPDERKNLKGIEKLIDNKIKRFEPEGIDLAASQDGESDHQNQNGHQEKPANNKNRRRNNGGEKANQKSNSSKNHARRRNGNGGHERPKRRSN